MLDRDKEEPLNYKSLFLTFKEERNSSCMTNKCQTDNLDYKNGLHVTIYKALKSEWWILSMTETVGQTVYTWTYRKFLTVPIRGYYKHRKGLEEYKGDFYWRE